MKIINEDGTLRDFEAWSGAIETQKKIIEKNKAEEFDNLIDELYPDGLTDVQLNDILWFEDEYIFEMLNIEVEE